MRQRRNKFWLRIVLTVFVMGSVGCQRKAPPTLDPVVHEATIGVDHGSAGTNQVVTVHGEVRCEGVPRRLILRVVGTMRDGTSFTAQKVSVAKIEEMVGGARFQQQVISPTTRGEYRIELLYERKVVATVPLEVK